MAIFANKQADYFELFAKGMDFSLSSVKMLKSCLSENNFFPDSLVQINRIKNDADVFLQSMYELTDKTFITPLDREDVLDIFNTINNLTISINDTANLISIFRPENLREDILGYMDLIDKSCEKLHQAMPELKNKSKTIKNTLHEVSQLKSKGNIYYYESINTLFKSQMGVAVIIKHRIVYDCFRESLECCKELAVLINKISIVKV